MSVKRIITSAAIILLTITSSMSGAAATPADLSVSVDETNGMTVGMTVDPAAYQLPSDSRMVLTPLVCADNSADTIALEPVVVAGRSSYFRLLRDNSPLPAGAKLLRADKDAPYNYRTSVPYRPWMDESKVILRSVREGCCGRHEWQNSEPVASIAMLPAESAMPEFIIPASIIDTDKIVELSGHAYIDFHLNRTEIDPSYRRNPAEIAGIIATIDSARLNPDATITSISIRGFASPEGSYVNNTRLAQGRCAALKDYVSRLYDFDTDIYITSYEPEDWISLRDSVAASSLPHRDELLAIIDSDLAPDARDAAMRQRYPDDYTVLLRDIYPSLRRSDYKVKYTIRRYTNLKEIARVMRERPANLSLAEFYRLAASYPSGSPEQCEVFATAVSVYPEDPGMIQAAEVLRRMQSEPALERRVIIVNDKLGTNE